MGRSPPKRGTRRKARAVVLDGIEVLRKRFASDSNTEGYRKDGPVAVAKFELGESEESDVKEARALRQREVTTVIEGLLARCNTD